MATPLIPYLVGVLLFDKVAKESDLGENDITYQTRTHLGHLLKVIR